MMWLEPWTPIERSEERAALQVELQVELCATHPLFGLSTRALARRHDQDDVLFELDDGRVAEVHLTWRGGPEIDPRWPRTTIYASVANWAESEMQIHHQDFESGS
jgi:hypothetical protein